MSDHVCEYCGKTAPEVRLYYGVIRLYCDSFACTQRDMWAHLTVLKIDPDRRINSLPYQDLPARKRLYFELHDAFNRRQERTKNTSWQEVGF